MLEGLSYDDVLLVPQLGVLEKRKDADITSALTFNLPIRVPIIAAPMPSVTEAEMAKAMINLGAQAVIHRFQSVEEQLDQYFEVLGATGEAPFVAIGVKNGFDYFTRLFRDDVRFFCLDVAHGHHEQVGDLLKKIKDSTDDPSLQVMAGNVATPAGALFLAQAGADAIKVGIGPGAACRTREVTGFGVPQFSAIRACYEQIESWDLGIPIVADGGIKNSGDAVKAFAAGASTIMLGSLLAGADEAPKPGEYFGNASARLNGHRAPEGVEGAVPLSGPVENILKEIMWGVRSGISYAGCTTLGELVDTEIIVVSPGTALESSVRV